MNTATTTKPAAAVGTQVDLKINTDVDTIPDVYSSPTTASIEVRPDAGAWEDEACEADTSAREIAIKRGGQVLLRSWVDFMVTYEAPISIDVSAVADAKLPQARALCENLTRRAYDDLMIRLPGSADAKPSSGLVGLVIDERDNRTYAKRISPREVVCRVRVRVLSTRTARSKELRAQSLSALQWPIEERIREEIAGLDMTHVEPMVAAPEPVLGYPTELHAAGAGPNGYLAAGRTAVNGIVSSIFGDLFPKLRRKQQVLLSAAPSEPGGRLVGEKKLMPREHDEEWLCGLFVVPDEEDEGRSS